MDSLVHGPCGLDAWLVTRAEACARHIHPAATDRGCWYVPQLTSTGRPNSASSMCITLALPCLDDMCGTRAVLHHMSMYVTNKPTLTSGQKIRTYNDYIHWRASPEGMPLWGPNRFWPGSGQVLRCLGPGYTVLALGPGFRPIIIIINDVTLFMMLSERSQ